MDIYDVLKKVLLIQNKGGKVSMDVTRTADEDTMVLVWFFETEYGTVHKAFSMEEMDKANEFMDRMVKKYVG